MVIVAFLILKILLILTFNKRKYPLIVSDSDVFIEAPEKSHLEKKNIFRKKIFHL